MEKRLLNLLRKINDTGRSVSWSKSGFLYRDGSDLEGLISVTIGSQDSPAKIVDGDCFSTSDIESMIHTIQGWMTAKGIAHG